MSQWRELKRVGWTTAAILGIALLIFMFNRRLGSTKDFWDIFTAVGTVAAAAIALAIGVRQEQVRWEDANQRAQLVAARLIPQLTATRDALKLLTSELRRYARFKSEWPNIIPWFDKLGDLARRPELPIPTSELAERWLR
ncbi:hypothetical protein R69927_02247 [Paraburkholderia domus]|jgi:hypothetical protein|uniref:Uncharacterized protein n=1 Tax=Paraburkholderia domus TaxID=2793075 RepID=A0A9N8MV56_9BURK|nr:hypothetical protein R69927_02247 [Paraburkholderia domus]CAE6859048.1 hypothetical protein R70006_07984 [Paraburkholderia domus]CAE6907552.1 hypothetical protein R70211_03688 [Paraburkholderia domus]CAE6907713.1 hypothetical protein R69749_08488 [Paraburkholderia domus]CAE6967425.1 hypothetical protein R75471_07158 [Paraburkholderia domus]